MTSQPWLAFTCPSCGQRPGYPCADDDGLPVVQAHNVRVRIGQEAARASQALQMATKPTTTDDTRSETRAAARAQIEAIWADHPSWRRAPARPDS